MNEVKCIKENLTYFAKSTGNISIFDAQGANTNANDNNLGLITLISK